MHTVIALVREHPKETRNLRNVGDTLLEQLTFAAGNREGLEELRPVQFEITLATRNSLDSAHQAHASLSPEPRRSVICIEGSVSGQSR